MIQKKNGLILFTVLTLVFGCNAPKDNLKKFNTFYETGDYTNCEIFAKSKLKKRTPPGGEDLLWAVQLASIERIMHSDSNSTELFDKAEDMLKYYDEQNKIVDAIGSTAVNDNFVAYKGEEYDGVMINTYKAISFMNEKKTDLARVEFNRSLDRQRRAKEKFVEEINKFKSAADKKKSENPLVKSSIDNPKVAEVLKQKYPDLSEYTAYPDFVNPFATYLAGLYFRVNGEYEKAVDLFKESYGMVPSNQYVADDLAEVETILDKTTTPQSTVWIIFENGLGPVKDEFRLDLPLFIATNQVKYVGIALPRLRLREEAYPSLAVEANSVTYNTSVIADMDSVIKAEFDKDFPAISDTGDYIGDRQSRCAIRDAAAAKRGTCLNFDGCLQLRDNSG